LVWDNDAPRDIERKWSRAELMLLDELFYNYSRGLWGPNHVPAFIGDTDSDSLDATNSFSLKFYMPSETVKVLRFTLRFWLLPFRAYSKTAAAGGGDSVTSGTSSATTTGLENWGTATWGGVILAAANHDHAGAVTADGAHSHYIYKHDHNIGHTHWVTVSDHTHTAVYGIYKGTSATGVTVTINGVDRTAALGGGTGFTTDQTDLDITAYVTYPEAENTITLTSTQLGRIRVQYDGIYLMTLPK